MCIRDSLSDTPSGGSPSAAPSTQAQALLALAQALAQALKEDVIAGAVIDVFEEEPAEASNPLLELDNVLLTPHCSGHSAESAENMSMVASDIIRVLRGRRPEYPVNDPTNPRQTVS